MLGFWDDEVVGVKVERKLEGIVGGIEGKGAMRGVGREEVEDMIYWCILYVVMQRIPEVEVGI